MQVVTLTVAVAASLLVLVLRPARAFAVYVLALLFYPTYLVVQVGPLDISAVRIIITVLLLRCLTEAKLRQGFKWCGLDSWLTFGAIIAIVIPLFAWQIPGMKALENRSGHLMDTFFAYLAARFCINSRASLVTAVKWIAVGFAGLAIVGIVESVTGWQSYNMLKVYCPWRSVSKPELNPRSGFYRAVGPFPHPITFGASFVIILPMVYWLRHEHGNWRMLSYWLCALVVVGAVSSMSSGPLMMIIFTFGCLAFEHCKKLVKPAILFFVFCCVAVEIISNRSFYDVFVSYANPIGGSGWHRSRLIHLAIDHFGEWWLAGYGGRDPGWGSSLGMTWTDITNHYIVAGVEYGLVGVIALCGALATAIYMLVRLHNSADDPVLRSWCWALGSIIVVLAISFNSIYFSGQAGTLVYCILGIIGSSPCFHPLALGATKDAANRCSRVMAPSQYASHFAERGL